MYLGCSQPPSHEELELLSQGDLEPLLLLASSRAEATSIAPPLQLQRAIRDTH